MTAAGGHAEAWPKVVTFAADCPSGKEVFDGVAFVEGSYPTGSDIVVASVDSNPSGARA